MNDLPEAIAKAVKIFNSMPADMQRAHREAQRRSWVIGELMLAHADWDRKRAEQVYNSSVKNG